MVTRKPPPPRRLCAHELSNSGEGAAIVVADALGDQFGLHAGASHERDCGVAEPVEPEVGDYECATVALFLVGEPGRQERRQPDRLKAGVAVDAALLGGEDDARPRGRTRSCSRRS